jgi:hypothetical protein
MAAAPTPDPSQQTQGAPPPPDPGAGGGAQGGAQGGPPPELMALNQVLNMLKQLSQQVPAFSAGLAKSIAGVNEAASAFMTQPQQQSPQQSPPQ